MLSLYEFRDHDLMLKLSEVGEISSVDLAGELGLDGEAARSAGTRMAWMRRYGMVQFDRKKKLWTLTRAGERVVAAKRRAALQNLIDQMPEGELIEAMAYITARYRLGEPMVAHMLRREFIYGTSPHSVVKGWRR
jgi:predicted ArsR family transcriptional regulator